MEKRTVQPEGPQSLRLVWFTTVKGGQLGIHRDNILFVGSEFVVTKNKFK